MSSESIEKKVKEQFGRSAASYVTSTVHAKGHTLARMVELAEPQPHWQVLDVATGGGHAAFAFAPHVAHVLATDLTSEMLTVAEKEAQRRGLENISFDSADACNLPYEDGRFDLVTCRIAPHHFADVFAFLLGAARVLKPGGMIIVVDNTVPDGFGGEYINAYETLRDPSHVACLSPEQWEQEFYGAGFDLKVSEQSKIEMEFEGWAKRMHVSAENRIRLIALLKQAPEEAAAILTPTFVGDRITFQLQRSVLVGIKR